MTDALAALPENERYGSETSPAGVRPPRRHLDLLGLEGRLFLVRGGRPAFFDELRFMLATQMVAPNSPQWFNTGLHWAYGIDGPARAISTSTPSPAS
jgi:ribonucleoside-diphosphate reductase alpha chain